MSIDSYGGDATVIATRDEILRVATELKLASQELTAVVPFEALLQDPLGQLQFRFLSASIYSKLEELYNRLQIAAEGYFTTEAQIHRRFEFAFIPELASLVIGAGSLLGWKLDSGVSVTSVSERKTLSPDSVTAILDRLWKVSESPMVGIDIFESENKRLALVYVPGTQSFSFGDSTNPLDMASNIEAMAGGNRAASEKAVIIAMEKAGITSSDEVIFVGHSQGGMVAGNLAANPGNYIAAGLITFGAPIAQLAIKKIPVMAVEHVNDPVPNIAGKANPLRSNWVTIQRESSPNESKAILHSHSLKSYKNTTEEIDVSNAKGVKTIRTSLLEKLGGKRSGRSLDLEISRTKEF